MRRENNGVRLQGWGSEKTSQESKIQRVPWGRGNSWAEGPEEKLSGQGAYMREEGE